MPKLKPLDGLYRVTGFTKKGPVAFGFVVHNGIVIRCAPYGYRWLWGRRIVSIIDNWYRTFELNYVCK